MIRILNGDCLTELPKLAAAGERYHAAVTDPPYHLTSQAVRELGHPSFNSNTMRERAAKKTGFMGKEWDGGDVAFRPETWRAVYDCLLPGAYLLAFGSTRGYHRMACAIEDAGFELRDCIMWMFASGFPKSHNISVAIDKAAGAVREVVGKSTRHNSHSNGSATSVGFQGGIPDITAPATPEAARWQGWGSSLKPAYEPVIVARRPIDTRPVRVVLTAEALATWEAKRCGRE